MTYAYIDVAWVKAETEKAFLLVVGRDEHWVPKSLVEDADAIDAGDKDIEVGVADWFLRNEGFEVD